MRPNFQSALKELVLVCTVNIHPPWIVIGGPMGSGCHKFYQSNPVTVADSVLNASRGVKTPKLRCNEDVVFLSGVRLISQVEF